MIFTNTKKITAQKKIKNINPYKSFVVLSIWEKIMMILCLIGFVCTLYFIVVGSKALFNSDTATANFLAREQIATGSFFPKDWVYVQDLWTFSLNIPIVLLSSIISNQILVRSLAVLLQTIILLLVLIIFSKKILNSNSWIVYCAILLSGISQYYNENMFGQAAYANITIFIFMLLIFGILSIDENFEISNNYFVVFSALLFTVSVGGIRYVASFLIPFVMAVLLVYYIENNNITLKESIKPAHNIFKWACILLTMTIGGFVAFYYLTSNGAFKADLSKPILLSAYDLDSLTTSIHTVIPSLWVLFGYDASVPLFSLNGIVTVIKIFAMGAFVFIFPLMLTRKYKLLSTNVKRFILFSWISLAITMILFIFVQGMGGILAARYFQVNVILQIIASSYYIYTFMLKRNFLTCFVSMCALVLLIGGFQLSFISMNNHVEEQLKPSYELVDSLKERNLKMGYASYWNAYKYSVFADFTPEIVAIIGDPIEPFYHLTSKRFYNSDYYVGKTFLMLTKEEYDWSMKDDKLFKQFGAPNDSYLENGYYINIYNYNIAQKFVNVEMIKGKKIDLLPAMVHNEKVTENEDHRLSVGAGGIVYGPYSDLKQGNYSLIANYSYTENQKPFKLKITADAGKFVIMEQEIHPGQNTVSFSLEKNMQDVEFVLSNDSNEIIIIENMEINLK